MNVKKIALGAYVLFAGYVFVSEFYYSYMEGFFGYSFLEWYETILFIFVLFGLVVYLFQIRSLQDVIWFWRIIFYLYILNLIFDLIWLFPDYDGFGPLGYLLIIALISPGYYVLYLLGFSIEKKEIKPD